MAVPPTHAKAGKSELLPTTYAGGDTNSLASPWTAPFLLVLGYLFIEFARPQDWFTPLQALRPGMIVMSGGILALISYGQFSLERLAKYIVAFLVVMAVMVPFATNNGRAFIFTKDFAIFLLGAVIPIMTFVTSPKQISILFRFWILINAVLALYGVTHGGRGVGAFLGDENDFCLAVNVALPYAFFMMGAAKNHLERLLLAGCVVLSLSAVVLSMSRGGFVGLVVVGIACWLRSPRKILSAIVVLLVVCGLSLTVSEKYWEEMQTITTADREGDTGATRLYFWGIAWEMFKDHPILGVGPANFMYVSYQYEDPSQAARGFHIWGKAAHSVYFTLLPEEGLAGTAIFVAIAVSGWRLRRQIGTQYRAFTAEFPDVGTRELRELYLLSRAADVSLLAYLVTGAFLSALYYPHFWLIAAFSVVIRRGFDLELERLRQACLPPAGVIPGCGRRRS